MTKIKAMPRRISLSTPTKHILLLGLLFLGHYFYHDVLDPLGPSTFDSPVGIAICCGVGIFMLGMYGLIFYIPIRCVYQIVESRAVREKFLYAVCLVGYSLIMFASLDIAILKERIYYETHRGDFATLQQGAVWPACYNPGWCLVELPDSLQAVFGESVMRGTWRNSQIILFHSRHNVAFVNIKNIALYETYKPDNAYITCFQRLGEDWYLCDVASGN